MASNYRAAVPFGVLEIIRILVWLLCIQSFMTPATQTDIDCLRAIKDSLHDPSNYLASWNFKNGTRTSIGRFTGIECWNADCNRVLNIKLSGMGLAGKFPLGVVNCTTMTGLDLSNNALSGTIPSNISHLIPFITSLDLSSNQFSGQIPENLANCSYLNILKLDNNQLTGQIPPQIGQLRRIKTFNVSNNYLTGPVPCCANRSACGSNSYANNPGLKPSPPCK